MLKPLQILIINYFGSNKGDAAILVGLIKHLKETRPGLSFTLISSAPKFVSQHFPADSIIVLKRPIRTRGETGGTLVNWVLRSTAWVVQSLIAAAGGGSTTLMRNLRLSRDNQAVIQAFKQADIVVSVGGGYLNDGWGLDFIGALHEIYLGLLLKKNIRLVNQSIGPFRKAWARWIVRRILNRVDLISCREPISLEYIDQLNIHHPLKTLSGDTAFLLEPAGPEQAFNILKKELISLDRPLVGITVIHWTYPGSRNPQARFKEYKGQMAFLADHIIEKLKARVLFIPMCTKGSCYDDRPIIRDIIKEMQHAELAASISGEYTAAETAGIIGCTGYMVGSRLHSVIMAALSAVPVLSIVYQPKAQGLMRLLDLEDCICDIHSMSTRELTATMDRIIDGRESIIAALKTGTAKITQLAGSTGDAILFQNETSASIEPGTEQPQSL